MPKGIAPLLIPKSELSNLPKKTKNFLMVEDFFFSWLHQEASSGISDIASREKKKTFFRSIPWPFTCRSEAKTRTGTILISQRGGSQRNQKSTKGFRNSGNRNFWNCCSWVAFPICPILGGKSCRQNTSALRTLCFSLDWFETDQIYFCTGIINCSQENRSKRYSWNCPQNSKELW